MVKVKGKFVAVKGVKIKFYAFLTLTLDVDE
jgi:hypothetical protein